jgi:hypothetical protein
MANAGAILAVGYWDTQTGPATAAPGTGKYQADNWTAPALLAISGTDADGYDRQAGLAALLPGDQVAQLSRADSQDYQRWTVTSVTDNGTWLGLGVTVAEAGPAFAAPGSNQTYLLEALVTAQAGSPIQWQSWAPPLNPPTAGGLDADTAQAIADATWNDDPHLCAALQWESYAATLPPSPSYGSVSTGAQAVSYQPPSPGGEYGAAMARAAWHRSLMGGLGTIPLTQAAPAVTSAPGDPYSSGLFGDLTWPVAL